MSRLHSLLERLDRVRQVGPHRWTACCPAHADRTPSLSISQVDGGKILLRCWAGCPTPDVLAAMGVAWPVLFPDEGRREPRGRAGHAVFSTRPPRRHEPCTRSPMEDVAGLWRASRSVWDDEEARAYLEGRGLDVPAIADLDAARVIPSEATIPGWARCNGRPWSATHRLLVRLFGSRGQFESLHARSVVEGMEPKSASPAGAQVAGLVMADPLGTQVLELGAAPAWWPSDEPLRVVVAEGATDYLKLLGSLREDRETLPAIFSIVSGSWTSDVADRIPDGATVIVSTDDDDAGNRYARTVADSIGSRCLVLRKPAAAFLRREAAA